MAVLPSKLHFTSAGGNQWAAGLRFYDFGKPVGNVLWVNSAHAAATDGTGYGYSPEAPLATIAYAVATAATADNHDHVLVLPNHTETITGAAGVTMSKAGVTVLGIGQGRQRPKVNYTSAVGASWDVGSARCVVQNLVFTMTGVDAVTAGINVSGADFVFADNEVEFADGTNQATLAMLTAATASRMQVLRNFFHGSANAGTAACIRHVAGDACRFEDNIITGNFTTSLGCIDNTAAVNDIQIHRNTFVNATASASAVIAAHASTTGAVTNNRFGVLTGTAPIGGGNALYLVAGNYYKAAAGVAAGTLQ